VLAAGQNDHDAVRGRNVTVHSAHKPATVRAAKVDTTQDTKKKHATTSEAESLVLA
jgi:hypothetical protein